MSLRLLITRIGSRFDELYLSVSLYSVLLKSSILGIYHLFLAFIIQLCDIVPNKENYISRGHSRYNNVYCYRVRKNICDDTYLIYSVSVFLLEVYKSE